MTSNELIVELAKVKAVFQQRAILSAMGVVQRELVEKKECRYGDPYCPCQDGDMCHYEGQNPMKPPVEFERCDICGDTHEGEVPRECETGDGI